jgi:protein TonB
MEIAENWLAALTLVEQALETSPESPQLLETADRLRSRKREDEMRKKLSRRIEAIQQKLGAGAWTEALSLIGSAQEEFPEDPALQELDEQARTGRRRAECDAVAADVGQYLAAGEPEKAEQVLRRAGNDASLDELWHEVEAGKQYREQCREAQSLLSRRKFREAEQLLASIAGERNLEARVLLESVRTARSASEEGDFYDQARERALRLIMEHEYTQAADLVRNLLNLFPGDPVLERDLERAEEGMLDEQKAAEPLPELPPIEFEPPLPPPPAAAFAMPPVTPAPRAEVPPPAPQRPREIPPPAPLPMAAPPAPPRPRVETVRPAPSQPVAQEPPRLELLGKRRRIQPYVLWPAIAASILIFLGTSGATIWKFSRREAQAAAPPRTAPVTSPRLEEEISPPVADRALAPAPVPVEKKSQEQTKPRPIVARQSFTPPKPAPVPASAPATLPSPGSEQVSVQQEPPRLPSAPGRIAPPPAAKPAEKSIQRQAQKSAQPSPPALIEPKPVNVAPPATPQLALQRGISGVVRLEATVSSRGNITQVKVLSGDPILAVAAKAAVWKWRYDPGTLNGRPTSMTVPIRITFESRK